MFKLDLACISGYNYHIGFIFYRDSGEDSMISHEEIILLNSTSKMYTTTTGTDSLIGMRMGEEDEDQNEFGVSPQLICALCG